MAGLFNSFYYGKAGKADFTPEQLPTNRRQLFFEMLRVRFSGIIGQNLLYVLIQLPAIVWTFMNGVVVMDVLNGTMPEVEAMLAGLPEAEAVLQRMEIFYGYVTTWLAGMVPCMVIAGAFKPGMVYVLRNWSRDQHSFVFSDFKDAVRDNWKTGILVGLINGLSLLVVFICFRYYGEMAKDTVFWVIPQMFVVVVGAVWWMANMLMFPMMVTYDMKFRQLARNSLIMVLARLPWSVLIWGGSLAVPLVLALFVPYGDLATLLIYLIVGFGITQFVYTSYANSCFDRFLNPRIEGAPMNMGLRDPAYDDMDDENEPSGDALS